MAPQPFLEQPLRDLAAWTNFMARQDIPVLRRTAARLAVLRQAEQEQGVEVDARMLADAVGDDPLMTLRVFSHVARLRGARTEAEVATVERAILMLGVAPFFRAFENLTTIEERLLGRRDAQAGLIKVMRRGQRAAEFAGEFAVWRNDVNAEEIMLASLLHDLAEMLAWSFAPSLMLRIRDMQARDPSLRSDAAQREVLNIELNELQIALARRWRLPTLLVSLMDDHHAEAPRVRNVLLAVRLARHTTVNWANPALPDDYRDLGALLSVTPAKAAEIAGAPEPTSPPAVLSA